MVKLLDVGRTAVSACAATGDAVSREPRRLRATTPLQSRGVRLEAVVAVRVGVAMTIRSSGVGSASPRHPRRARGERTAPGPTEILVTKGQGRPARREREGRPWDAGTPQRRTS